MSRIGRLLMLGTLLASPLASPLEAQRDAVGSCTSTCGPRCASRGDASGPHVEVQLPTASRLTVEGPLVRARSVLSDSRMRELLRSGFPARLRFRVELWSSERWFDELLGTAEWNVTVQWRGVDQKYEVLQIIGERTLSLGSFARIEDAESAVERPLRVPMAAPASNHRRFYYEVSLDVQTLSVTDLDEVNRWLRGEVQPAFRGDRHPGTAFTRGVRSLMTRLLGGEQRGYTARTDTFRTSR